MVGFGEENSMLALSMDENEYHSMGVNVSGVLQNQPASPTSHSKSPNKMFETRSTPGTQKPLNLFKFRGFVFLVKTVAYA